MKLIEQDEKDTFYKVLEHYGLPANDFDLSETDTTDPKTDEIFALAGFVVVTRKSTRQSIEYPTGDGYTWIKKFESDVANHLFGYR